MPSPAMRTPLLIVALAVAGALLGLATAHWIATPARLEGAEVGRPRPDFERPDLDGASRRASEWDGRLVLLNFWASWCGPCREEMPLLDRTQRKHAGRGLQVIGIAADSAGATRAFLARFPVAYPILVDDPALGRDVSRDYGNRMNVLPYTVLIGRDGRILAQRAGNFTEARLEEWLAPHL